MRPPRVFSPQAAVQAALLGAVLGACASTGANAGSAPVESANTTTQSTVRVDGGAGSTYQTQLTHQDAATTTDLAVPADRAFAVLPLVYEQLGLAVNTAVSDTRTVGVSAARLRRVGKEAMSRFLACGTDVVGTPLADSYAVTLTVLSRVTPGGAAASTLSTQVIGSAQPMSVSGTTVSCQSTGALEDRIAKALLVRAAGG